MRVTNDVINEISEDAWNSLPKEAGFTNDNNYDKYLLDIKNYPHLFVDKSRPIGATESRPNGASRRQGISGFGRVGF